eukprot:1141358-Pelagomonas_calceolata.AAC.15
MWCVCVAAATRSCSAPSPRKALLAMRLIPDHRAGPRNFILPEGSSAKGGHDVLHVQGAMCFQCAKVQCLPRSDVHPRCNVQRGCMLSQTECRQAQRQPKVTLKEQAQTVISECWWASQIPCRKIPGRKKSQS